MPNRILKESIRESRKVNSLTDFDFRVWAYLITYADDYGRGSADPELLKGIVFPRRKGITETQIQKALSDLANTGMVILYRVDGESFFYFPNWDKHQTIRAKKSKFPPPENGEQLQADDFICKQTQADASICSRNPIQSESNPNTNPNTNPKCASAREKPSKKTDFKPPTLEEVREYCTQRQSPVDPKKFWEYFEAGEWVDSKGEPVRNWKQKLLTWERSEVSSPAKGRNAPPAGNWPETPPAGEMDRMAEMLRRMGGDG